MWYGVSEESLHTYEASGLSHSEGFTNYSVDIASVSDWDEGSGYSDIVIDDLDRIVKVQVHCERIARNTNSRARRRPRSLI